MSTPVAIFQILDHGVVIATVANAPGPAGSTAEINPASTGPDYSISLWPISPAHEGELGALLRTASGMADFLDRVREHGWQVAELAQED